MDLLHILLQADSAGGMLGGGAGGWIMIILLFVIMYFFMIRPQQKKQKEIQKMREGMKVGDKIVTAGGIHGKIKDINDTTFTIEIAENVRIKVDKASIYSANEGAQAPR
jgi:preprotein translocase, YajC subunit